MVASYAISDVELLPVFCEVLIILDKVVVSRALQYSLNGLT